VVVSSKGRGFIRTAKGREMQHGFSGQVLSENVLKNCLRSRFGLMMYHPFLQKAQKRMGHGKFVLVRKRDEAKIFKRL